MHIVSRLFSMVLGCSIAVCFGQSLPSAGPAGDGSTNSSSIATDEVISRVVSREHEEVSAISRLRPLIETYIQDVKPEREENALWRDWYFLGQAQFGARGVAVKPLVSVKDEPAPKGLIMGLYNPAGFLQEAFVDPAVFDKQHYVFAFAGREFLGEVRCLMFDVEPRRGTGRGRFRGRIWVEDQDYTIVRFSGAFVPTRYTTFKVHIFPDDAINSHFDSWRLNVQPNLWLPSYIFSEELNLKTGLRWGFKAQTRLWGYNAQNSKPQQDFSKLSIESPAMSGGVRETDKQDRSPLEAQRQWRREAESNVVSALEGIGLISPPGEIDKALDTVVNNLEVSNGLDIEPDVRCRLLTTTNFDIFPIGHTIVISRGLIDALPDEATLAAILAQPLADVIEAQASVDRFGFGDVVQVSPQNVMRRFRNHTPKSEIQLDNNKALELLKHSPYADKLANAGLFLKELATQSNTLPQLIHPSLGNQVYMSKQLLALGPKLEPERLDQIAALPIGARVKIDPWTDNAGFLKAESVRPTSRREKLPFEITPFMPFLTRYKQSVEFDSTEGTEEALSSVNLR